MENPLLAFKNWSNFTDEQLTAIALFRGTTAAACCVILFVMLVILLVLARFYYQRVNLWDCSKMPHHWVHSS